MGAQFRLGAFFCGERWSKAPVPIAKSTRVPRVATSQRGVGILHYACRAAIRVIAFRFLQESVVSL